MRASLLIALLLLCNCGGNSSSSEAKWQLLGSSRPSALLSVWASSGTDVWVCGGREGAGLGPSVFHYDGSAWTKLDSGVTNVDLWWVFGTDDGTVFFGGSNGTILMYSGGTFTKLTTPTTDTVFGIWGASSSDVWAVGGQPSGSPFVWHYQGSAFQTVTGLPADLTMGPVWKVTGRSASDVYMSAAQGYVLHWDGTQITPQAVGMTDESLFSIGCSDNVCVTAGTDFANGVLYENDGNGWSSRVPTQDGPVWRGVTQTGDDMYVVGMFGAMLHLNGTSWVSEAQGQTTQSLHDVWANTDGTVFAVGGEFDQTPTTQGVLIYQGTPPIPALP